MILNYYDDNVKTLILNLSIIEIQIKNSTYNVSLDNNLDIIITTVNYITGFPKLMVNLQPITFYSMNTNFKLTNTGPSINLMDYYNLDDGTQKAILTKLDNHPTLERFYYF